jgi:hypothetical protein
MGTFALWDTALYDETELTLKLRRDMEQCIGESRAIGLNICIEGHCTV